METVQTTHSTSVYCDLPLVQLQESASNPRRRYHRKRLKELAQSFQSQGVLEPLLVRMLEPEHYEIVVGSRRFRAAKLAGLETVPVKIVEKTAQQALEAQCVENRQREDVHPLEEAQGFSNLVEQGYDVETIAARIGKPPTFVAQRLRLTELVPSIAEAFLEGKIPLAHATLIARLPAAQQPEAFTAAFRSVYLTGGLTSILVPAKELAGWIEANLLLDLDKVPFDKTDATLLPEAGSCDQCSKRTGFNTLLFPDATADRCTDRACFQGKIDRHIQRQKDGKPDLIRISTAWGPKSDGILGRNEYTVVTAPAKGKRKAAADNPAHKRCSHLADALVTEGTNRGQTLTICAEPECEVHHAELQRARREREQTRLARRREERKRKIEFVTRERVLGAILDKVETPLSKPNLQVVAAAFFECLSPNYQTAIAKRHNDDVGMLGQDAHELGLSRLLVEMALTEPVFNAYSKHGGALIESIAKRLRIPIEKIAKEVNAEFAAQPKKRDEGAKAPKRAKKKSAG